MNVIIIIVQSLTAGRTTWQVKFFRTPPSTLKPRQLYGSGCTDKLVSDSRRRVKKKGFSLKTNIVPIKKKKRGFFDFLV